VKHLITTPNQYCAVSFRYIKKPDDGTDMLRGLSIFGLGGGFLMISPGLRLTVLTGIGTGVHTMSLYAPWSYCGAVSLGLVFLCTVLYRGAQPR